MPQPGNPQTLNRYSYANANPVKYTDPSGHDVDCGIGICQHPIKNVTELEKKRFAQAIEKEAGGFRRSPVQDDAFKLVANGVANRMEARGGNQGSITDALTDAIDAFNPNKGGSFENSGLPEPDRYTLDFVGDVIKCVTPDTINRAQFFVGRGQWYKQAIEAYPDLAPQDALTEYINRVKEDNSDMISVEYTNSRDETQGLYAYREYPPPDVKAEEKEEKK